MKCSLVSLIFQKRSLVYHFYCFPLFLCNDHGGRLSYSFLLFFGILCSNGYIFLFLLCLKLLFFSQLFVSPPQTAIFPFCISFSWGWSWLLPPVQRHERPSIFLQALCLSDLIPWMSLSLPLYNLKGFYSGHTGSSGFPYFLQFKSEFVKKEFMIWATVSSWSCFCWLCRASLSLAAKNIINLISVLCCWKRVFAMTSAFSWQNSISLCPASFHTPRPNLLLQVFLDFLLLHSSPL